MVRDNTIIIKEKESRPKKETSKVNLRRFQRIIFLSVILLISVGLFFALNMKPDIPPVVPNLLEVERNEQITNSKLPPPGSFQSFTYIKGTEKLPVEGVCKDAFYVVLIYPKSIDYRVSALDAKYNTATPCPKTGRFNTTINVSSPPFEENGHYYLIRGDQGKKGSWYNPY